MAVLVELVSIVAVIMSMVSNARMAVSFTTGKKSVNLPSHRKRGCGISSFVILQTRMRSLTMEINLFFFFFVFFCFKLPLDSY